MREEAVFELRREWQKGLGKGFQTEDELGQRSRGGNKLDLIGTVTRLWRWAWRGEWCQVTSERSAESDQVEPRHRCREDGYYATCHQKPLTAFRYRHEGIQSTFVKHHLRCQAENTLSRLGVEAGRPVWREKYISPGTVRLALTSGL